MRSVECNLDDESDLMCRVAVVVSIKKTTITAATTLTEPFLTSSKVPRLLLISLENPKNQPYRDVLVEVMDYMASSSLTLTDREEANLFPKMKRALTPMCKSRQIPYTCIPTRQWRYLYWTVEQTRRHGKRELRLFIPTTMVIF